MRCLIVIPTYNRAGQIGRAIAAALDQSHHDVQVAVIDDGSADDTRAVCAAWFDHPQFVYLALGANLGTAGAKNLALALLPFDAVTFHDSDDIPHRDKVLRQARTLARTDLIADACLPWQHAGSGQTPGQPAALDIVLTAHRFLSRDGRSARIARTLSLVDDFFPQLQFAAGPLGDWVLINSGLFRRSLFAQIGGYCDSIEEDRDLRNRAIMAGANIWFIDDVLLTKIDSTDGLTNEPATGYDSPRRLADRAAVWQAIADWRAGQPPAALPIDLPDVGLAYSSRPELLHISEEIPIAPATRSWLETAAAGLL